MSDTGSIRHMPAGRWQFDADVTRVFDDMLERSIPAYTEMRRLVFEIGRRFVRPGRYVVDLGCSRGEALAPLVAEFGESARYTAVEVSAPMREAAAERFEAELANGSMRILDLDLRTGYPDVRAALTLSVLTLQFIPIEHRPRVVQDVFDHTAGGGAFVLVEKVIGESAHLNEVLADVYRDHKRASGYSEAAIDRKRLSLEGVLVPITAAWNEQLLRQAGFSEVECFWRWANFAGWLAVKE
jgi:tRNA (cmo5U34)-methyltransferase